MKRCLLNILAAFSLLLCVTTVVLWVRSYWHPDSIGWFHTLSWAESTFQSVGRRGSDLEVDTYEGHIVLKWNSELNLSESGSWKFNSREAWPGFFAEDPSWRERFIFFYECYVETAPPSSASTFAVHDFWLVALMLVLPAMWLISERKRRRRLRSGLCRKCGYDLRASKDRCPECGTAIPAGASPVGEDKPASRSS